MRRDADELEGGDKSRGSTTEDQTIKNTYNWINRAFPNACNTVTYHLTFSLIDNKEETFL